MSRHQLTSRIAYEIYLQRGCTPGRHHEDWRAAETIVGWCLAFATELVRATEPEEPAGEVLQVDRPSLEERALKLLTEAVAASSRKAVASQLGYKSTSSVGRYLRKDRPLGEAVAQKIIASLAKEQGSARRAA